MTKITKRILINKLVRNVRLEHAQKNYNKNRKNNIKCKLLHTLIIIISLRCFNI